jgi:hypothetical protein
MSNNRESYKVLLFVSRNYLNEWMKGMEYRRIFQIYFPINTLARKKYIYIFYWILEKESLRQLDVK